MIEAEELRNEILDKQLLKKEYAESFIDGLGTQTALLQHINVRPVEDTEDFKEVCIEMYVPNTIFEDSKDPNKIILDLACQRIGRDLEELIIKGGTDSEDVYLETATGLKAKAKAVGKEANIPPEYLRVVPWSMRHKSPVATPFLNQEIIGVPRGEIVLGIGKKIEMEIYPNRIKGDSDSDSDNDSDRPDQEDIEVMVYKMTLLIDLRVPGEVFLEKLA